MKTLSTALMTIGIACATVVMIVTVNIHETIATLTVPEEVMDWYELAKILSSVGIPAMMGGIPAYLLRNRFL